MTSTINNNRETDYQTTERTIIDDNRVDESNRCATNVEHLNEDSVLSTSNVTRRKTTLSGTKLVTETKATREADKEEHSREDLDDEVELRNTEQKEQCLEIGERTERCIDHLKETEATVTGQVGRDEYCQGNSNDKINPQDMEECVERRLDAKQSVNEVEEEPVVEQDLFLSLLRRLEEYGER